MKGLSNIVKRWFRPQQAAGIEFLIGHKQPSWRVVVLQNHKGDINTLQKAAGLSSPEELHQFIPEGTPISLYLNGRGILHKLIPQKDLSPEAALQKALPNATPQQFYIQQQLTADGCYVSIARRKLVDELLEQLQQQKLSICRLAFGPFELRQLLPVLSEQHQLIAQEQLLCFDDHGQLVEMTTANEQRGTLLQLGEEAWNSADLPAYAGALCSLMEKPSAVPVAPLEAARQEWFHRQLFYKGGVALLAGFILLLLLNTAIYYWYKGENEKIQFQLLHSSSQLEQLDTLRNQVERQQRLLAASGILQQSRSSFYADRLAASLPKDLKLVQLDIFPPIKKQHQLDSEEELAIFHHNLIRLKGQCKSSLSYNEWVKALQAMEWIGEVQHLNYQDVSPRLGTFEIELTIAP